MTDHNSYLSRPEDLRFDKITAEQREILNELNMRSKSAIVVAVSMGVLISIITTVSCAAEFGTVWGIVCLIICAALVIATVLVLRAKTKTYTDYEMIPVEIICDNENKVGDDPYGVWSEEQQKFVRGIKDHRRDGIAGGVKAFYVKAIYEGGVDYLVITQGEFSAMSSQARARR